MNGKIKNFMEYVSSDETLKAELQAELENTEQEDRVSRIIQFAKKHGHEFTEEEFTSECDELDDNELEAVVGGGFCLCAFGGGGKGDGLICACALYGTGGVGKPTPGSQGGCQCVMGGGGKGHRH